MKKKIKDLTISEIYKLCNASPHGCDNCPYKLVEIKLNFFNKYDSEEHTNREGYSYCILNLFEYMNSEIEVEDDE